MRTAAAHVRVDWLVITMAVLMMGGCSRLGGGTYTLEVHNRTTVPIKLAPGSWSSGDTIVLACESATFIWGRGSATNQSGSMPAPDGVAIEVPVSMSPPADPSNDRTQSLIVSAGGVSGHEGATVPSMPPCEGQPPAD